MLKALGFDLKSKKLPAIILTQVNNTEVPFSVQLLLAFFHGSGIYSGLGEIADGDY